jgi:hypothetical protein
MCCRDLFGTLPRSVLVSLGFGSSVSALRPLGFAVLGALGIVSSACGARPLLPTFALHGVLILHRADGDAKQAGSHDVGLQAQISFRPRGAARAPAVSPLLPIPLPMLPDCEYSLACEWAQLAEESALSALGVGP